MHCGFILFCDQSVIGRFGQVTIIGSKWSARVLFHRSFQNYICGHGILRRAIVKSLLLSDVDGLNNTFFTLLIQMINYDHTKMSKNDIGYWCWLTCILILPGLLCHCPTLGPVFTSTSFSQITFCSSAYGTLCHLKWKIGGDISMNLSMDFPMTEPTHLKLIIGVDVPNRVYLLENSDTFLRFNIIILYTYTYDFKSFVSSRE